MSQYARNPHPCSTCHGRRKVKCSKCDGAGHYNDNEYDYVTRSTRYVYRSCHKCSAQGRIVCPSCDGSGYKKGNENTRTEYLDLAHDAFQQSNIDNAILYYKKAGEITGYDTFIYLGLSDCYYQKKDYQQSIGYCNLAENKSLKDDLKFVYANRMSAKYSSGDFSGALLDAKAFYRTEYELDNKWYARYMEAQCLEKLGKINEAKAILKEISERATNSEYRNLAKSDFQKLSKTKTTVNENFISDGTLYLFGRQSFTKINEIEWSQKTVADYSNAIQLYPQNYDLYLWRALAYVKQGDFEKARADINNGMNSKNNCFAFMVRGDYFKMKISKEEDTPDTESKNTASPIKFPRNHFDWHNRPSKEEDTPDTESKNTASPIKFSRNHFDWHNRPSKEEDTLDTESKNTSSSIKFPRNPLGLPNKYFREKALSDYKLALEYAQSVDEVVFIKNRINLLQKFN